MEIDILSLFPEYFKSPFEVSILKRAIEKGLLNIRNVNIRDFSEDEKHNKVDDRPFGGGPGMVIQPQPLVSAIRKVKKEHSHVIYLSPQGKRLNAKRCERLARYPHLVLICGHYEGIDERVIQKEVNEEISIGDYVLTSGCLPAMVLIDAISRFVPGVLGNPDAAKEDTFQNGVFDGPQYTRPEVFEGMKVPDVLLSGNHEEIKHWRLREGLKKMKIVRPDLYTKYLLDRVVKKPKLEKNLASTNKEK